MKIDFIKDKDNSTNKVNQRKIDCFLWVNRNIFMSGFLLSQKEKRWPNHYTLGARGSFFLLFAVKIKRRSRDLDERFFFPLVTIAASPLNFHRKQQEKKPVSSTYFTSLQATACAWKLKPRLFLCVDETLSFFVRNGGLIVSSARNTQTIFISK